MAKNKLFLSGIHFICFTIVVAITSFIKFNYIVGSVSSFFHGSSVITPLVSVWLGSYGAALYFLSRALCKSFLGFSALHYALYHIPSVCGALYWSISSSFFRVGFPLVCMGAFLAHQEGASAAAYSLYWLIPIIIHVSKARGVFWQALACSFTVHAAGSIIWLYTASIPAGVWLSLIPIVALERILCASGMVLALWLAEAAKKQTAQLYGDVLFFIKSKRLYVRN